MKLDIKANDPLVLQPSLFGPPRPVFPAFWRGQGDRLKVAREDRGLTPGEGAARLGLTRDELAGVERGAFVFDLDTAVAKLRRGGHA